MQGGARPYNWGYPDLDGGFGKISEKIVIMHCSTTLKTLS